MNEFGIVLLDGAAKTSKTTIGQGMVEFLAREHNAHFNFGDAGTYFRRLTALVFEKVGLESDIHAQSGPDLSHALDIVLREGEALNDDRPWGDLDTIFISERVASIGALPQAQQSSIEWYAKIAQHAFDSGKDGVVINGRVPRTKLASWMREQGRRPDLELYVQCAPVEAARRLLLKEGIDAPSEAQLTSAAQRIVARREKDARRADYPAIEPTHLVSYIPDLSPITAAHTAVDASWEAASDIAPLPISFDTTHLSLEAMVDRANRLAEYALVVTDVVVGT